MDQMWMEKAYQIGIFDTEWVSIIELAGEVGYATRTKEARREMVREATKEGRYPLDGASSTLTDLERLYLTAFAG